MIEPVLVPRSQINDTSWNTLIAKSGYPLPYSTTWHLDCVSPHWKAIVWPQHSDYQIVMPLPVRKKWGKQVIQQPFFCQFLGFFSVQKLTTAQILAFLAVLHRHFSYISSYSFHPGHTPLLRPLLTEDPDFSLSIQATYYLKTSSDVRTGFTKDRLANLKRAERWGWQVLNSSEIEPLISLFRHNHARQITGGVNNEAYALLRKLYTTGVQQGMMRLQYATLQGSIHAGCLFLEYQNQTIYIFNAADTAGRKGNARTYLLDRYLSTMPAGRFDFESPDVPSIATFYQSFGAEKQEYLTIKKNKLPFPFRQLQEWRKRWFTST